MFPSLFPNNGLVILLRRSLLRFQNQPVIRAGDDLRFSFKNFLELQLRSASLVVLRDGVFGDVCHVRIVKVTDR